jgi:TetR/AcrR family transcriptional regulator, transcriptional repressor for nem operon
MPWSREHKSATRTRILDAAAAEFRARGIAAVAVSDVMDRAGLTHGGFYAHFSSKDDLAAQALRHASAQTTAAFDRTATAADDAGRLQAVIDLYLHPAHLAHPERGCAVAALGTEAVRGGRSVRRSLSAGIRARLDRLRRLLPRSDSRRVRDQKAAGVFACMVGGLILARGLGQEEGDRLLADCRAFLRSALTDSPH